MFDLTKQPRPDMDPPQYTEAALARIFELAPPEISSLREMQDWLVDHGVDLATADSRKGLQKLFTKIEKGEARLVFDSESGNVFRCARVAKLAVDATIHGERYPLIELCQIFLAEPVTEGVLELTDPEEVGDLLAKIKIKGAQVRNSQELWETLVANEDAEAGARRGLVEELRMSEADAASADLRMTQTRVEYEAPIDWPGIHSVLETNEGRAILPPEISRAAYVELEAGDQLTIFVATPGAAVVQGLLRQVLPGIHYVQSPQI